MLFALLSTFIWSVADVFWKKSLNYKVGPRAHELSCYPIALLILAYFILSGFSFSSLDFKAYLAIIAIVVVDVIRQPVMQQVYREEKLSLIMPYLNLSKIFVILLWFFLFKDVSYTTLVIALITVWIIMIWKIDFTTLKLPRNFQKILFVELCRTSSAIIWWWIILRYWDIALFNLYVIFWCSFILLLTLQTGQFNDIKSKPLAFWKYRQIAAMWWFGWFLSLVVIKNLWLSLSILLWFLGIATTLFLSYIVLWDKPQKKDLILTAVVSLLIWIWYYFK